LNQTGPAITDSHRFPVLEDGHNVAKRVDVHIGEEEIVEFFDNDDEKDMTDGAQILSVNKNETCTFKPSYDAQGKIQAIIGCDKQVAVFNHNIVEMTIVYALTKHILSGLHSLFSSQRLPNIIGGHDVMGMFAFRFSRDPKIRR
jgi:hypothetical protein